MKRLPVLLFVLAGHVAAQEVTLDLDPTKSTVQIKLGATLHTVHGTFQVKRGRVILDSATGKISGEVVVDATSGVTGNSDRDRTMHKSVLESARYSEIGFRPSRISGVPNSERASKVELTGMITLHGTSHEITIPLEVVRTPGAYSATGAFTIPYVKWGMKNPSNLLLRVSDRVEITIRAVLVAQMTDVKPGF
jgi:polyisoprenoid-binding protein YceI